MNYLLSIVRFVKKQPIKTFPIAMCLVPISVCGYEVAYYAKANNFPMFILVTFGLMLGLVALLYATVLGDPIHGTEN